MDAKARAVYKFIRDQFDARVRGLTPVQFRAVMEELQSYLEAHTEALDQEDEERAKGESGG